MPSGRTSFKHNDAARLIRATKAAGCAVKGVTLKEASSRCWSRREPPAPSAPPPIASLRSLWRAMKRDVKGLHKVVSKGQVYWYAWRERGAPRVYGEYGTADFWASYDAAIRERHLRFYRRTT